MSEVDDKDTVGSSVASVPAALPSLDYSLRTRKLSITIFWSLIILDSVAMPIAMYFGLSRGTNLSPNALFSIVTAALGGVSIVEYVYRFWQLWKVTSTCRPEGAGRKEFDWFHWTFSFMWFFVIAEMVIGTSFDNPPIRLLSMPLATVLWVYGSIFLVMDTLRLLRRPSPLRISSIPKGDPIPPSIYPIVEDIIAVDGGAGTAFRDRLRQRFDASPQFRYMMDRLSFLWGIGAEAMAILTTVLVFTLHGETAYVVGWSIPFVWAGVWAGLTYWFVRGQLVKEKEDKQVDSA